MSENILLHLSILLGIWFLGIPGTFASEEIMESSNFLFRQKRVVSYIPGEDISVRISDAPYVVRIRENTRNICTGSILSFHVVITAAACVSLNSRNYEVVSNSAYTPKNVVIKNVIEIKKRMDTYQNHMNVNDGIALLVVNSPFEFTPHSQPIRLHIGPVLVGIFGQIHGWGFNFRSENRGTNNPTVLRAIEVPVILHEDCANRYRPHLVLPEKTICTYHPQRHSGHTDFGAGLVVENRLAGVLLWSGLIGQMNPDYPEVFASLEAPYYNQWIRSNLESIDPHFQSHHHH